MRDYVLGLCLQHAAVLALDLWTHVMHSCGGREGYDANPGSPMRDHCWANRAEGSNKMDAGRHAKAIHNSHPEHTQHGCLMRGCQRECSLDIWMALE